MPRSFVVVVGLVHVALGTACEPELEEPDCAALDALTVKPDWPPLFGQGRKDKPCKVALIDAGMERTGSTLLASLAASAIVQTGLTHVSLTEAFWRLDRHVNNRNLNWTLPDIPTETDVVLFKTHEYDSELANEVCEQSIVLLTNREPLETAMSLVHMFNREGKLSCDDIYGMLSQGEREHRCWLRKANFPIILGDVTRRKRKTVATIARILQQVVGSEDDDMSRYIHDYYKFDINHLKQDANPRIPGLHQSKKLEDLQMLAGTILPEGCRDYHRYRYCFPNHYNH